MLKPCLFITKSRVLNGIVLLNIKILASERKIAIAKSRQNKTFSGYSYQQLSFFCHLAEENPKKRIIMKNSNKFSLKYVGAVELETFAYDDPPPPLMCFQLKEAKVGWYNETFEKCLRQQRQGYARCYRWFKVWRLSEDSPHALITLISIPILLSDFVAFLALQGRQPGGIIPHLIQPEVIPQPNSPKVAGYVKWHDDLLVVSAIWVGGGIGEWCLSAKFLNDSWGLRKGSYLLSRTTA